MRVNARRRLKMSEAGDDAVQERPDAAVLPCRRERGCEHALHVPMIPGATRSASVHFRHDALTDHRDASLLLHDIYLQKMDQLSCGEMMRK